MRTVLVLLVLAYVQLWSASTPPAQVDLRVEQAPLLQLFERLARQCKVGLHADRDVIGTLQQKETLFVKDAKWQDALDLFERQYGLKVSIQDDRLRIVDAQKHLRRQLVIKNYDIRHLLQPRQIYPESGHDLPEPGGTSMLTPVPRPANNGLEIQDIIDMLSDTFGEVWNQDGSSLDEWNGGLVISHLPAVHERIFAFLQQLERIESRQVIVRCWKLPKAQQPRGHAPVLSAAAWTKLRGQLTTPAATFILSDTSRGHHSSGRQQLAVTDSDVVGDGHDPIVTPLVDGLSIDCLVQVTVDGVVATTRFADLGEISLDKKRLQRGDKTIATMELPSQAAELVQDTRVVPVGGAAIYRSADRAYALSFQVFNLPKAKTKLEKQAATERK